MKEKLQKIGNLGIVYAGGMNINVKVIDYKQSYGRDRWLVSPMSGSGVVWTESVNFKATRCSKCDKLYDDQELTDSEEMWACPMCGTDEFLIDIK